MHLVGYIYIILLSVQFGIQPLLTRVLVSNEALIPMVVLVTELLKGLIASFVLLFLHRPQTLHRWTLAGSLKIAGLPALSYAAQNHFSWLAMRNLDSVSFNLQNQSKLIATAGFVYVICGQMPTQKQMFAMFLVIGAMILVIRAAEAKEAVDGADSFVGFVAGSVANSLSGFGAALSQRTLQKENRDSIVFTAELAMLSGAFQLATFPFRAEIRDAWGHGNSIRGLFIGFDAACFIPLLTSALGGFLVGLVTKYAGSVMKGFAVILGITLTMILQAVVERKSLEKEVYIAFVMASFAIYIHTRPSKKQNTVDKTK